MLYGLDICAGSGIGSAAFEAIRFCRTVCYVERDAYCQRLLRQRMQDGWLCSAPIWDDLKTFDGRPWHGLVDFVFGGIPCQPHSLAGKRAGRADERDLWPDFWRVVREVGPRVVLVENVPGLLSSDGGRFMGRILGDLASGGYDAEWDCIPAAAVGAPHRRDRVWIVAYADGRRREECHGQRQTVALHQSDADSEAELANAQVQPIRSGLCASEQAGQRGRRLGDGGSQGDVADADHEHADCTGSGAGERPQQREAGVRDGWWELEPDVDRVADGVASRVDRLRTIGNGWVPQVAAVVAGRIGRRLLR
jgi:DNA (cytosine-5)-methyltransferase 1